jgi:hypothetical protein
MSLPNNRLTPTTTAQQNTQRNTSSATGTNIQNQQKRNNSNTSKSDQAPPAFLNNIRSKTSNAFNKVQSTVSETVADVQETVSDKIEGNEDFLGALLKIIIVILILVALFYILRYFFNKYQLSVVESPYLLEGLKNAKHALVISQDPNNAGYVPMPRSEGKDGIQFTYSFWLMIEGYDYKSGEWKHVFHKGDPNSYPNRAPGVWLHPATNGMRVYMNTQTTILEYVDVMNLPLRKWIHVAIVLDDKDLDVYINGYLKSRKQLSSVPKLNNGDFWCNMFGGFEGFVGRIQYFAKAIGPDELSSIVKEGPGSGTCVGTEEVPPYLDDNWWLD